MAELGFNRVLATPNQSFASSMNVIARSDADAFAADLRPIIGQLSFGQLPVRGLKGFPKLFAVTLYESVDCQYLNSDKGTRQPC